MTKYRYYKAYLYSLCKKVEQMNKLASSHTLLVYNTYQPRETYRSSSFSDDLEQYWQAADHFTVTRLSFFPLLRFPFLNFLVLFLAGSAL